MDVQGLFKAIKLLSPSQLREVLLNKDHGKYFRYRIEGDKCQVKLNDYNTKNYVSEPIEESQKIIEKFISNKICLLTKNSVQWLNPTASLNLLEDWNEEGILAVIKSVKDQSKRYANINDESRLGKYVTKHRLSIQFSSEISSVNGTSKVVETFHTQMVINNYVKDGSIEIKEADWDGKDQEK